MRPIRLKVFREIETVMSRDHKAYSGMSEVHMRTLHGNGIPGRNGCPVPSHFARTQTSTEVIP
jgi:hypothetical protein